ncbi:MAG: Mut7-C RNAse domain-containing protein [Chroococcales cyanobacterium]
MEQVHFRFFGELNYFLPPSKKQERFPHGFEERTSIKDMIEGIGVPHPEVDVILVDGKAVDFNYIVSDRHEIEVYPASVSPSIPSIIHLQPSPPKTPRFVLDVHLGKLASALRMLGFDTLYRNDYEDETLAEISAAENRIVLTRDRGVLMRSIVELGYYVRSTKRDLQIVEVMQRYNLFEAVKPFQRCIRCNGLLIPVDKALIIDQLPPKTQQAIDEFHRCDECEQVYWRGAHFERMQTFVDKVINSH